MRPRGLYGRLVAGSQSISTRRLLLFLSGILLLSLSALLFIPSALTADSHSVLKKFEVGDTVSETLHELNPFKPATHKPPAPQTNSTASTESWFSSWKWLNPFSSNIADDEERSVLPPLPKRCPVYTFYEPGEDAETEDKLLLVWRRAWWAQGFEPVILGMGEAKEHGLYRVVRDTNKFKPEFEREVMRWLAWSQMGTGVLADYRIIPMAPRTDHTLSALRRCDFVYATRYENWGHRLFAGDKPSVDAVLKHITTGGLKPDTTTIESAVKGADLFHIDPIPTSFADYTPSSMSKYHPTLPSTSLPALINAHLHEAFLSHYPHGISLLSPFPETLGALHHQSLILSNRLSFCPPTNPTPSSCPPNLPSCTPCTNLKITPSLTLTNKTGFFHIGTIPHPYTFLTLRHPDLNLATAPPDRSLRFIRRSTQRDEWLRGATPGVILGPAPRVVQLKHAIADAGAGTLLVTSDAGFEGVEWTLGFVAPTMEQLGRELPGPDGAQRELLERAHREVRSGGRVRKVVEMWNLGSTEAWKFAGAVGERGRMERRRWSEREKAFGKGLSVEEK